MAGGQSGWAGVEEGRLGKRREARPGLELDDAFHLPHTYLSQLETSFLMIACSNLCVQLFRTDSERRIW